VKISRTTRLENEYHQDAEEIYSKKAMMAARQQDARTDVPPRFRAWDNHCCCCDTEQTLCVKPDVGDRVGGAAELDKGDFVPNTHSGCSPLAVPSTVVDAVGQYSGVSANGEAFVLV
jgi:hypothetical protein